MILSLATCCYGADAGARSNEAVVRLLRLEPGETRTLTCRLASLRYASGIPPKLLKELKSQNKKKTFPPQNGFGGQF
jgi:hypothetical protein